MATSLDNLKNAFIGALDLDPNIDFNKVAYAETEGWDSVAHMRLIAEIESRFDIMLSSEDVIELSSFNRAKELVGKYGVSI